MSDLILRPTIIGGDKLTNDYKVIFEGRPIGRIRQATEGAPMSDFSKFHNSESEALHKALFQLHDDIYFKGAKRIKDALLVLHKLEVESSDVRPQCRVYIGAFEALRDQLDFIGRVAADLRSKLIHENGCDGSCSPQP